MSITSLDGGFSGIPDLDSLKEYNEQHNIYIDEPDIKTLTPFYPYVESVLSKFKNHLGNVSYHAACHQRVQNIGQKTREFLSLIPDTSVTMIERCSGHDGTYALKEESYEHAMKIARPVLRRIQESQPDTYGSDCPMAGRLIAHGMNDESNPESPLKMLARAYGLGN